MLWNVKKFTKQDDLDLLNTDLHPLVKRLIPEFINRVRKSRFNYENISLYWDEKRSLGPVHVLMDNYRVGKINVEMVGNTYKLNVIPKTHVKYLTPTVSVTKTAQHMIAELRPFTPFEEAIAMATDIKLAITGEVNHTWSTLTTQFNNASSKIDGYLRAGISTMAGEVILGRLVQLWKMSETELSPQALRTAFVEWVDEGVFDSYEMYEGIKKLRDALVQIETHNNSGMEGSMYVREWSDGTGIIITYTGGTPIRHYCSNLHEQMPAEYASKLAMLKVSGLTFIPDVGVMCDPRPIHDSLTETVYYFI
jgi:hypothetical protein